MRNEIIALCFATFSCSRLSDPVDAMQAASVPFGSELLSIQKEIAEADRPNDFYAKTYSRAEPFYWAKIADWLRADSNSRHFERILDIGCGYGTLLVYASNLYKASGYCMDVTPYLKSDVRWVHNLTFVQGSIELVPIPWPDKFDIILFTEVLEHFNFQPVPTLRKMRAALADGGRLYLSTPDQASWGKRMKYYHRLEDLPEANHDKPIVDDHIWIYSKEELISALQDAGFTIERFDYSPGLNGARHFNVIAR